MNHVDLSSLTLKGSLLSMTASQHYLRLWGDSTYIHIFWARTKFRLPWQISLTLKICSNLLLLSLIPSARPPRLSETWESIWLIPLCRYTDGAQLRQSYEAHIDQAAASEPAHLLAWQLAVNPFFEYQVRFSGIARDLQQIEAGEGMFFSSSVPYCLESY